MAVTGSSYNFAVLSTAAIGGCVGKFFVHRDDSRLAYPPANLMPAGYR